MIETRIASVGNLEINVSKMEERSVINMSVSGEFAGNVFEADVITLVVNNNALDRVLSVFNQDKITVKEI